MNKIVGHPIVKEKLTWLRNKRTNSKMFRELVNEILPFLLYEATKDLPIEEVEVQTPLAKTNGYRLKNDIVLVPVLRAGLGMVDTAAQIFPNARVGHIGLYRDKNTFQPIQYYIKFPPIGPNTFVIVLDPMLATGNSSIYAIEVLTKLHPWKIQYVGLVASAYGVQKLNQTFSNVDVCVAAIDPHLNDNNYIVPGLGDAGDRLFGTS